MGFFDAFDRKKEVKLTLEEQQKENKQLIRKACRELQREKNALERQEKKTVMDIKAKAKKGEMSSVKIMAKDLVRNRKYQTKFMEMQSNLQGVQLKMRTMQTSAQMAQAMSGSSKIINSKSNLYTTSNQKTKLRNKKLQFKFFIIVVMYRVPFFIICVFTFLTGVTKAMSMTTKNMDIQGINQMMMEFQRESEKMNIMGDMVDDAIGDAMDDIEDEEATENLVAQVLDEIGVEFSTAAGMAPSGAMPTPNRVGAKSETAKVAEAEGVDADLMDRLNALKK